MIIFCHGYVAFMTLIENAIKNLNSCSTSGRAFVDTLLDSRFIEFFNVGLMGTNEKSATCVITPYFSLRLCCVLTTNHFYY